ncbi:hypothetical protein [Ideonella sp.]|uniref:hypothetical protein n=1 Tax=Ideonella sp. TaxID=1929293 RepID=UPI002B470203|nr:hypothetical protein [Ideonella sp.]HJV69416.1 hypothetical protein [Ideonella sp.]
MSTSLHARFAHALAPLALAGAFAFAPAAQAQEFGNFFPAGDIPKGLAGIHPPCRGKVKQVNDTVFEGVKTTAWNFAMLGGGGEGGRFDPVPVLSTKVNLTAGCLNAHFSALVGSKLYGVSNMTLFQVTLTPAGAAAPMHMAGHYETPYGLPAPAVALTAEYDVDMLGANFYQGIGTGPGLVAPGAYRVDVWWAGGPVGGGGAIGAAFTLKLYQY